MSNTPISRTLPDTTFVIKTFERPNVLYMLLRSIDVFYPNTPVIVIDDSREALDDSGFASNVTYVPTEYNIGLSEGRNRGVDLAQTEYTLILDDDVVFTEKSRVDLMKETLSEHGFALCGSRMMNFGSEEVIFHGGLLEKDGSIFFDKGRPSGHQNGFPIYDFCHNFLLGRTQFFKDNPWDPELKLKEHWDFFYRIKQKSAGLVTMHHDTSFEHYPLRPATYQALRSERKNKHYMEFALEKHGFKSLGKVDDMQTGLRSKHMKGQSTKHTRKNSRVELGIAFLVAVLLSLLF